jgi:hypothetical protein
MFHITLKEKTVSFHGKSIQGRKGSCHFLKGDGKKPFHIKLADISKIEATSLDPKTQKPKCEENRGKWVNLVHLDGTSTLGKIRKCEDDHLRVKTLSQDSKIFHEETVSYWAVDILPIQSETLEGYRSLLLQSLSDFWENKDFKKSILKRLRAEVPEKFSAKNIAEFKERKSAAKEKLKKWGKIEAAFSRLLKADELAEKLLRK